MSTRDSYSPPTPEVQRKRIARACEGCRLRKTKCDGGKPCHKCKVSNIICTTWRSKKQKEKVYAKGYVDVLERRQAQLIAGLEETYHRLVAAHLWPGQTLPEKSGHPLVHDILETLHILETNDEASDSESGECESEQRRSLDSERTMPEHRGRRGTQSPPAEAQNQSISGKKSLAPRVKKEQASTAASASSAFTKSSSSKTPLPVKLDRDDSVSTSPTTTTSSMPKLETEAVPSSSPTVTDVPYWPTSGTSADNSITIPGTPDTTSPWEQHHPFSPDMTDLVMDMDFDPELLLQMQQDPQQQQQQQTSKSMKSSSNNNLPHWWMADDQPAPETSSTSSFPESMSTCGMDELSNMLYHDICSDASMFDMYQRHNGGYFSPARTQQPENGNEGVFYR